MSRIQSWMGTGDAELNQQDKEPSLGWISWLGIGDGVE